MNLLSYEDSSWCVFSYLVLQHLPTEELAITYVQEMLRVLRPGGAFLFQFNGSYKSTTNLPGRVLWGSCRRAMVGAIENPGRAPRVHASEFSLSHQSIER